jgi:hypothetical protein
LSLAGLAEDGKLKERNWRLCGSILSSMLKGIP